MNNMKKVVLLLTIFFCTVTSKAAERQVHVRHFGEGEGFSTTLVLHAIQDSLGYIWLATWDGLRRYDGYRFHKFKAQPGDNCPLETNRISFIKEDSNHNIICWSNEKFYLFNRHTQLFEHYHGKEVKVSAYRASQEMIEMVRNIKGFENIELTILLRDRQQGLWVYSHRGLERISTVPKPVSTKKYSEEREEIISALYVDRQNRLWISDKNGYIHFTDSTGLTKWISSDGQVLKRKVCFGHSAYCFFEDSKGLLWIGAKPGGLFRLTPDADGYKVRHFTHDSHDAYSLNCESVYDIAEDARHRLVIATFGGGVNIAEPQSDGSMRFIHPGNLLKTFPKAGLKSRCLKLLSEDIALLGTNDGLYTFSLRELYGQMHFYVNKRRPDDPSSLNSNFVMEILRTKVGEIFIATSGGGTDKILSKQLLSDTISFRHFSEREGISSDMNQTLAEDNRGNVWIVSAGSLSLLNTSTKVATNFWRLLDSHELITEATPAMLPDGSMVLGTSVGTLTLSPDDLKKSSFTPQIVFDCDKTIELPPDEKDFNIRFTALDYNKNEEIVYAYKMEGRDDKWHYTRHNELNYVNLAPGKYTLHIKSTNGDGVWTDNEETITLYRSAHFNETPLAWMLYGLLLTLLLTAVWGTWKYILTLQRELKDLRLSSKEQMEVLGARIKELLPIGESVKEIREDDKQLSEEDLLFSQKLKAYIENNIGNPDLSVPDLAQAMNVSRTVLFVRMKNIFNSSPNNYVLNTRIHYAKTLLVQPGVHVSDVAYRCGFSDPKYFSRCFKKLVGVLPKDYVDSIRQALYP